MGSIQENYMAAAMERRALESKDFRDARIQRAEACQASGKHLAETFEHEGTSGYCAVCGFRGALVEVEVFVVPGVSA